MQASAAPKVFQNKSQALIFFETDSAPDIFVLEWINSNRLSSSVKCVIIVGQFHLSHKRLPYSENLQVLFLLKKQKKIFKIEKICIQKNPDYKLSNFEQFKREFLNFTNSTNFTSSTNSNSPKIVFSLSELFELMPISIAKPWGQEIWYTGIESRGVSRIQTIQGSNVPLSWVIGSVPYLILGKKFVQKDPILIKILDPFPQEVLGDLYYELHVKKNEVYVVTDITKEPGSIKIGINEEKLNLYQNDIKKYKDDFLKCILEYEKIRRKIDAIQEKEISHLLQEEEIQLRKHMDSFCGFVQLNIGDVINIPTHVPHALQHGVRVIEFQTPTYERYIISFAQKVLTQSHWDTKVAFDVMRLEIFKQKNLKILSKTKFMLKELVCLFSDFKVSRWSVKIRTTFRIPKKPYYRIVFFMLGEFLMGRQVFSNKCALIPQSKGFTFYSKEKSILLLCEPI